MSACISRAQRTVAAIDDEGKRALCMESLKSDCSPEMKVRAFHALFDVPVGERPTHDIVHMSNERLAMRLGLALEETRELFKDGFGIDMDITFRVGEQQEPEDLAVLDADDHDLSTPITAMLKASGKRDLVQAADALADRVYVDFGMAAEMGIMLTPVFSEVHASNMTKANEDGTVTLRDDGKIMKGENYLKANVVAVIESQMDEGDRHHTVSPSELLDLPA